MQAFSCIPLVSPRHVPTINDYILPRHVSRSLTSHEHRDALEIIRLSPIAHRNATREKVKIGFQFRIRPGVFVEIGLDPPARRCQNSATQAGNILVAEGCTCETYPGDTQFTRIPRPAHSLLSARVSCNTPPLLAAYADILTPPCIAARDAHINDNAVLPVSYQISTEGSTCGKSAGQVRL